MIRLPVVTDQTGRCMWMRHTLTVGSAHNESMKNLQMYCKVPLCICRTLLCRGQKDLCKQISTVEARKVKHIAHIFQVVRCKVTFPGMPKITSFYNPIILCILMRWALLYFPEFMFTYPKPFLLKLKHWF